jgi:GTP-binding protein
VRAELAEYGGGLADKPELIGLNKADAMTPREVSSRRAALAKASGRPVLVLSGVSGQGVPEVRRALQRTITTFPSPSRGEGEKRLGSGLRITPLPATTDRA